MKYMIATAAAIAVCILLGTAMAWLAARHRNMPPRRKALLAAVFSVLLLAVVSLGYLETYYRAGETAKAYLAGEPAQVLSGDANADTNADASSSQGAVPVSIQKTDTGYFLTGRENPPPSFSTAAPKWRRPPTRRSCTTSGSAPITELLFFNISVRGSDPGFFMEIKGRSIIQ